MSNIISKLWLSSASLFDPVQYFFNGEFWYEFLQRLKLYTRGDVVDLACGTGELRKYISPRSYLGIDINQEYITQAKASFEKKKNSSFRVGNILEHNLEKADTVFFISAAHHLNDNQIKALSQSLESSMVVKFVLVDGYPIGPFKKALSFLDAYLGGGKYFRNVSQLVDLVSPYLRVIESGEFSARRSFYRYPFLIATAIKP